MSQTGLPPLVEIQSDYSFRAGESYDTYEEFLAKLESHSAQDLVYYWRRDSRTIEGAALKTARPIAKVLRYYSVRYSCIFGGQKFETKSTGAKKRPSLRNDCPAFISLRASKCGQRLTVVAVSNMHNHEVTQEVTKHLAHQKKLSADMKQEVLMLLYQNVDRKLIKEYVLLKDGKELTTKDLCNLAAAVRKSTHYKQIVVDPKKCSEVTSELMEFLKRNRSAVLSGFDEEQHVKTEQQKILELDVASQGIEMLEERLLDEFEDNASELDSRVLNDSREQELESVPYSVDLPKQEYIVEVLEDTPDQLLPLEMAYQRNRTRWKSASCFACGSNNRLVRAQLSVLRAQREKLREEVQILRLKKIKLRLELRAMNKNVNIK